MWYNCSMMSDDYVFMQYYMPSRVLVNAPSGRSYVFVTKHNICGAMVHPDDVEFISNKRGGCCGQQRTGVFFVGGDRSKSKWEA